MVVFDQRLHLDTGTAGQIEAMLSLVLELPTVVLAAGYPFPLTAKIAGEDVWVRAATSEETTAFLTAGDVPNADGLDWPGDPAMPTGREIEWQETQQSEPQIERACHLWNGEVILKSGWGLSSPFYVHEEAARAWTLSTAHAMEFRDVFGLQVVPYACARRFAPELIKGGEVECNRLNRFWISPVRSWGQIVQFPLPGREY
jgi:hypothetical protein